MAGLFSIAMALEPDNYMKKTDSGKIPDPAYCHPSSICLWLN
jgi:hypothetical protein